LLISHTPTLDWKTHFFVLQMMEHILVSVLLSWTALVSGSQYFQALIPNGDSVPHPCNVGETWPGVGHKASGGGGARNPFGLDFAANGLVWNPTLCQQDSDDDGLSNGQELGDPDCVWITGAVPARDATSHPGICDPVDAEKCKEKNTFLTCTTTAYTLPASNSTTETPSIPSTIQ
jgi:dopamine beta-monooxygenase